MTFTALTFTRTSDVAEIVLNRPEVFNCFDEVLHLEMVEVLTQLREDSEVRAVVLASTGKAFSAGGDFAWMQRANADPDVRQEMVAGARRLLDEVLALPQPIIAAVQGPAVGLGATVALLCDALVMGPRASLADTHVNVGLVAGDGGCLVWPQALGMLRARRHLLTGDPLDAETAFRLGAATDLVGSTDEVIPAARAIAARIAGHAPLAVRGTKAALNQLSGLRAAEVVDLSLSLEEETLGSADLLEGVAAFQERRPPAFKGR